jgi:hypothetical protein
LIAINSYIHWSYGIKHSQFTVQEWQIPCGAPSSESQNASNRTANRENPRPSGHQIGTTGAGAKAFAPDLERRLLA